MPDLTQSFIHLGLGATAIPQPPFSNGSWYQGYGERHDGDGAEGRLVSMYVFAADWQEWEMHPTGSEVVLCTAGRMTLHQAFEDGTTATVTIGPGEYAINPPGCWHTADIENSASAVFITAGLGTQGRPR